MLIALPAMAAVIGIASLGLIYGVESLQHWSARATLIELQSEPQLPEQAQRNMLQSARGQLSVTAGGHANSPERHDLLGQLLFWEAINLQSVGWQRSDTLKAAEAAYRQAISLRPTWPYYWANLALAKAERGVFDPEFRKALRQAIESGPWEPRIQLQLIRMDFTEQQRIDRKSRELIDGVIRNAMRSQPAATVSLAREFGQMERVCDWANDDRWVRICGD